MKRLAVILPLICLLLTGCVNGQVPIPQKQAPRVDIGILESGIAVGLSDDQNPVMILEEYSCPACAKWEQEHGDGLNGAILDGRLTAVFLPVDIKDVDRSLILSARLYDIAKKGVPQEYLKARQEILLTMLAPDKGAAKFAGWEAPSNEALDWAGKASAINIKNAVAENGIVTTPSFSRDITAEVQ